MNRDEVPQHIPIHPQPNGWANMIVIAVFIERFFTVGVTKSSGIFLLRLVEQYHVTSTCGGLAFVMAFVIFAVGAPSLTVLGETTGQRLMFILSGIISVLILGTAGTVVTSVPILIVFMGLSLGIVNACCYGNGLVMLGKYFRTERQTATNVASCGGSIGQIILPFVLQYLINEYGLKGALAVSGALLLHSAVAGVLLRPIRIERPLPPNHDFINNEYDSRISFESDFSDFEKERRISTSSIVFEEQRHNHENGRTKRTSDSSTAPSVVIGSCNQLGNPPTSSVKNHNSKPGIPTIVIHNDKGESFCLSTAEDWDESYNGGNIGDCRLGIETSRRKPEINFEDEALPDGKIIISRRRESVPRRCSSASDGKSNSISKYNYKNHKDMSRNRLTASNADLQFNEIVCDIETGKARYVKVKKSTNNKKLIQGRNRKISQASVHSFYVSSKSKLSSSIRLVFDFSVLKNVDTLLFVVLSFLFYMVWYNIVLILPGVLVLDNKDIRNYTAALLLSLLGTGDLIARLFYCIQSCQNWNSISCFPSANQIQRYRLQLKAIPVLFGSINLALLIPASGLQQLALFSFLHGLFCGMFESYLPSVLLDFVGVGKIAQTLGIMLLFQGMGGASGHVLLGYTKDCTDSYAISIGLSCTALALVSVLLFLFPILRFNR